MATVTFIQMWQFQLRSNLSANVLKIFLKIFEPQQVVHANFAVYGYLLKLIVFGSTPSIGKLPAMFKPVRK
jgi:hypothetical protein